MTKKPKTHKTAGANDALDAIEASGLRITQEIGMDAHLLTPDRVGETRIQ